MMVRPGLASGWIVTVPAQSFVAPVRAWVIAAARVIPGVCAVLRSSCALGMILTPWSRQFRSDDETISSSVRSLSSLFEFRQKPLYQSTILMLFRLNVRV